MHSVKIVTTLCVSDHATLASLTARASTRIHQAFRPKTPQTYCSMFCIFLAFCIFNKVSLACVIANYVSAIRANVVLYDLPFSLLDHPKIKYFVKSVRINRPLAVKSHNTIENTWLRAIS